MSVRSLSILTVVLFILSLGVYYQENKKGTDLVAGSDFIKGLDVSRIHKLVISFYGDKKIILTRDGNRFMLENHKSYPAASNKVNDLLFKIANLQVKEKVGEGTTEAELGKYQLTDIDRKYKIEIFDNNDKKTISFKVGKQFKNKGNFLQKDGSEEVYLSQNSLWLNSSYKDFVDMVLLGVKDDKIERVSIKGNKKLEIIKENENFKVSGVKEDKLKEEKVKDYVKSFKNIRFTRFYTHSDKEVQNLKFDTDINIELKNKIVYKLSLASKNDKYFAKINALTNEIPDNVVVKKDDGLDKLMNIEEMINAKGNAQAINLEKGNWIYEIDKSTKEKIVKDSNYFL
jgi:hypothetical protein